MLSEREVGEPEADPREIGVWSRRYAQNRTLPLLIQLLMFGVLFGALAASSYFVGWAFLAGQRAWAPLALGLLALSLALYAWSLTRHYQKTLQRIGGWAYRGEGQVSLTAPRVRRWLDLLVMVGFSGCVAFSVALGLAGRLSSLYLQPVSALYSVPFLLYLYFRFRSVTSPLTLLWPTLYALHAVLLLLGAPIHFSGSLESLNMLVPVVGYGLIAALAGHIYSRYALRRLRQLAAVTPEEGD